MQSRLHFTDCISPESGSNIRHRFCQREIGTVIAQHSFKDAANSCSNLSYFIDDANEVTQYRLADIRRRYIELINQPGLAEQRHIVEAKAALDATPLYFASQFLIHALSGNWNNETRYALTAQNIHAIDLGFGQPKASRIDRYQELMRYHRLAKCCSNMRMAAQEPNISEGAFSYATRLMILSYFPETFTGEILGANLYLRQCGLLPNLEIASSSCPETRVFLDLSINPRNELDELGSLSWQVVEEYVETDATKHVKSVVAGYSWARHETEVFLEQQLRVLQRWWDPREPVRQLIRLRRLDASQYHKDTKLDGQSMQALLHTEDCRKFLLYLERSRYVKPGKPEKSPLLNNLIAPNGKMFRIFNEYEINALKQWIVNLPYESEVQDVAACELWVDQGTFSIKKMTPSAITTCKPTSIRSAYSRLLHTEVFPEDENYAKCYADAWLQRAKKAVAADDCPLPANWAPGKLQVWMQGMHESSSIQFGNDSDELPDRDAVIADILSLAPLTMIDGAWLTGFTHPAIASSEYGYPLFETLFDELGNGVYEQNHPVVYRELVKYVYGDIPLKNNTEFADLPCFKEQDFALPVFWLSIGRYSSSYLPEVLGLNFAMELSGVGGGYRRTHKALAAYKFPTTFVDLHNSIDNISTGHSAWAAASLDAAVFALPEMDKAEFWSRVRNGYAALNLTAEKITLFSKIRTMMKIQL